MHTNVISSETAVCTVGCAKNNAAWCVESANPETAVCTVGCAKKQRGLVCGECKPIMKKTSLRAENLVPEVAQRTEHTTSETQTRDL